jgi:hypothetical protein
MLDIQPSVIPGVVPLVGLISCMSQSDMPIMQEGRSIEFQRFEREVWAAILSL